MKKLVIAANGHPRTNNDLLHLQDAIIDVGKAVGMLCSESSSTLVLIGGLYTINVVPGVGYDLSDAYFFYQNELFYFPGATNAQDVTHLRISSTFAANNPYMGKNIHNTRVLIPISTTPIAGDIVFSFTYAVDAIAKKSIGVWQNMNAAGSANFPQFHAGIVNASGHTVQYRKLSNGQYEFRGRANVGGYTGSSLGDFSLINFGAGLMTTNTSQHGVTAGAFNGGANQKPCVFGVSNSGIEIKHEVGYSLLTNDLIYFTGIRFYEVM